MLIAPAHSPNFSCGSCTLVKQLKTSDRHGSAERLPGPWRPGSLGASSRPPNVPSHEPPNAVLARRRRVPHEADPSLAAFLPALEPTLEPRPVDEHLHGHVLEPVAAHVDTVDGPTGRARLCS